MRRICILLFTLLLIPLAPFEGGLLSQNNKSVNDELDDCKERYIILWKKLEAVRDSLKTANEKITEYKARDSARLNELLQLRIADKKCEEQLEIFKMKEAEQPPFIKWEGFAAGLGTVYYFDSTLISSTLVNRLAHNGFFFGEARITINERIVLSGEAGIPFNDKFYLRAKIGYRLF